MSKEKWIMIGDWVPLQNKGEEAIIRGIEDMYMNVAPSSSVQIGLFDLVDNYQVKGNIHIFPLKWVYPYYDSFLYKNFNIRKLFLIGKSICNRLGLHNYSKNIFSDRYPELYNFIKSSEIVFVGHDGSFSPFGAGVLSVLQKHNVNTAIIGAGFTPNRILIPFIKHYWTSLFLKCKFITLREERTYKFVKALVPNKENVLLAPDPAFFFTEADELPESFKKLNFGVSGNSLVGVTVCENSIVFKEAFRNEGLGFSAKQEFHAKYIASLLENLANINKCTFVFLPHCIEEGIGNDIRVAKSVAMHLRKDSYVILENDYSVREMKRILAEFDFVIGERTHSIINSISIGTPFVAITNTQDKRTHDIVANMCGLNYIINLDYSDVDGHSQFINETFAARLQIKDGLAAISTKMRLKLQKVASELL